MHIITVRTVHLSFFPHPHYHFYNMYDHLISTLLPVQGIAVCIFSVEELMDEENEVFSVETCPDATAA